MYKFKYFNSIILFAAVGLIFFVNTASASNPHAAFIEGEPVNIEDAKTYFSSTDNATATYVPLSHITRTVHTTDDDLSNLIKVTARGLNYDPERIYEFVRNNIDFHPVFGESKGAYGALIDLEGTAFDQSRLALLLLQESNGKNGLSVTAKIQIGNVTLSQSQWNDWFGFSDKKTVCRLLANGGIPSSLSSCTTASGQVSNIQIGHAWLEVTINGGTSEVWDVTYKKRSLLKPSSVLLNEARKDGQSGSPALDTPFDKILASALTGTDGTTSVPYITNIDSDGLKVDLAAASTNLDAFLKTPANYELSLKQLVGGYVISQFEQLTSKAPLTNYVAWVAAGHDDIPDKFRIILDVDVDSVGYAAHFNGDFPEHISESLISSRVAADEVYGRLFRLKARPNCQPMKYSDDFPIGAHCLMLSIGNENIAAVTRGALILLPGLTNKKTPPDKKRVDIKVTYNHPYPNRSLVSAYVGDRDQGDFQDGDYGKRVSLFSDTIIVNAWGKTSSRIISDWNARLGLDVAVPADGNPCGIADPEATGDYNCLQKSRSSNIVRHKLAASYMAQSSKFIELLSGVGDANITHHRTIGFVFGTSIIKDLNSAQVSNVTGSPVVMSNDTYFASADNSMFFDIRPSISIASRANDAGKETAAKRSFATISSGLEGIVFTHVMGAFDTVSTGSKFAWAAKKPPRDTDGPEDSQHGIDDPIAEFDPDLPRYFLFTPGNFNQSVAHQLLKSDNYHRIPNIALSGTEDPKYPAILQLNNYIDAGYDIVLPSETYLGPGPRKGTTVGIYSRKICALRNVGMLCFTVRFKIHNPHPSRGSAMVAWKDTDTKIGHAIVRREGIQKGGGISSAPGEFKLPSLPQSDKFIDPAEQVSVKYSVDPKTGTVTYDTGSLLTVGNSSANNELSISYNFSSGIKSPSDLNQWTSNWKMGARVSSSGLEALGVSRPDNAAPSIAMIAAMLENYGTTTVNDYDIIAREVAGPLIMNWWGEQTNNNTVSFQQGASGTTYVRKSDGNYNPPHGQPGMQLVQTGEPVMQEVIPLTPPSADPIVLKSTYSRKWDYGNVDFTLTNNFEKTTYNFTRSFGPSWPLFRDDIQNTDDPIDWITAWGVISIDNNVSSDITYSGNAISNDRGQQLNFTGFYDASDDNGRSVSIENLKSFPKKFTDAVGNTTHLEYYSGSRVQEGVTLTPDYSLEGGFFGTGISPAYLYEYPFVGIKEIYEPGLTPGVDTPSASIAYDELDNVLSVTDAEGRVTYYGQAIGRNTSVIDNAGNETISKYDEYGRLIELIEPAHTGDGQ